MWTAVAGFRIFAVHGLPVIIGAAIVMSAVRQRMPVLWPMVALVVVSALGALTNFDFTDGPPGQRHLMIGAGFSLEAMRQTMTHVVANLAVLLALYAAARKRFSAKSPG